MLRRILDFFSRMDNHMDILDDLAEKVESAVGRLRSHYGY